MRMDIQLSRLSEIRVPAVETVLTAQNMRGTTLNSEKTSKCYKIDKNTKHPKHAVFSSDMVAII